MTQSYRTANRHSMSFKVRRFVRRTRARILESLIQMLDDGTRATAA